MHRFIAKVADKGVSSVVERVFIKLAAKKNKNNRDDDDDDAFETREKNDAKQQIS